MSRNDITVAVVKGGRSSEREVSLASGAECARALRSLGYNVVEIDSKLDIISDLGSLKPNVIFNALHGRWGEDGIVQGCLEWLGIPYTHSGVLASALAMNKQKARELFALSGLPVANGFIIASETLKSTHPMTTPYVIKPNNEGSSVGVHIIRNINTPSNKIFDTKLQLPKNVLVEEFIPGRELTVTVMNNKPLAITEIISPDWYDYKAKYQSGGSKHILPARVPSEVSDACFKYALCAHSALGCRGLTRTDFRWNDSLGLDGLIVLEINTQPGMTSTSLVPEQAKACGISFQDLCEWIVQDASCLR